MLYKLTCRDKADLTFIHYSWSFRSESALIEKIARKFGWEVLDVETQPLFSYIVGRFFGTAGSATTVSIEALILFYRQFAMMQQNGVNLKVALELCAQSAEDKRMRYVCETLMTDIKNGKPLAEAMAGFPYVFDRMSAAMINAGIKSNSLGETLAGLAVSSGSACTSASLEPSYVLRALGRSDELAHSSIRFTIGRFTTEEEVDFAIELVKTQVAKLRELSPLWDMYKEGIDINTIQWATH